MRGLLEGIFAQGQVYVLVSRGTDPRNFHLLGLPLVDMLEEVAKAWRAAGLALAQGPEHMASEDDDAWLKPYDHESGQEQRMRDYLTWETALIPAVERDGCARFRLFPDS